MASKDVTKLLRELRRHGIPVEERKKHFRATGPKGMVVIAKTPSDHRWQKNATADLRRAGIEWPPPKKRRKA